MDTIGGQGGMKREHILPEMSVQTDHRSVEHNDGILAPALEFIAAPGTSTHGNSTAYMAKGPITRFVSYQPLETCKLLIYLDFSMVM